MEKGCDKMFEQIFRRDEDVNVRKILSLNQIVRLKLNRIFNTNVLTNSPHISRGNVYKSFG